MKRYHVIFTILLLNVVSCSLELEPYGSLESGEGYITFSQVGFNVNTAAITRGVYDIDANDNLQDSVKVYMKDGGPMYGYAPTKAAPVSSMNEFSSFTLFGYSYSGSWTGSEEPEYASKETVNRESNVWRTESYFSKPESGQKVRFYGVAPISPSGLEFRNSMMDGCPSFTYITPGDVSDQKDICIGRSVSDWTGSGNPSMAFSHCMAAVSLKAGATVFDGTVDSITFENIYLSAVYDFESGWSEHGNIGDITVTLDKAVTQESVNEALTNAAQTLMLIPQTLPSGARLYLNITDSEGVEHTVSASIGGGTWLEGRTVTYGIGFDPSLNGDPWITITTGDGEFFLSLDESVSSAHTITYSEDAENWVQWDGSEMQLSENSIYYVLVDDGINLKEGSSFQKDNDGTWTDSVSIFTDEADYDRSGNEISIGMLEVEAEEIGYKWPVQAASMTPVGSASSPVDLSRTDVFDSTSPLGTRNTANTYVVTHPGTYMIPLVYGNAIENGVANPGSYSTNNSDNYIMSVFKNAYNTGISSPYIDVDCINNGCSVESTGLVRESVPGLIQLKDELYVESGITYLVFEVTPEDITYGNAVVSVSDNEGTIVWSWNIWITAEIPRNIPTPGTYDAILSQYLGATPPITYSFMKHGVEYKAAYTLEDSVGSSSDIILRAVRHEDGISLTRNEWQSTFYNRGRHVAFYDDDQETFIKVASVSSVRKYFYQAIQTPYNAYISTANTIWYLDCAGRFFNCWDMDSTSSTFQSDQPVQKTVYDPCIKGYHIPRRDAFVKYSKTNYRTSNYSDFNVIDTDGNGSITWNDFLEGNGWTFTMGYDNPSYWNYFPAVYPIGSGEWHQTSNLYGVGSWLSSIEDHYSNGSQQPGRFDSYWNYLIVNNAGGGTSTGICVWGSNTLYPVRPQITGDTIYPEPISFGTFAGLNIAPAPLYYSSANGYEIKDDDWNHESYNSVFGENDGSYYFSYDDIYSYFDWNSTKRSVSYGGYDDWRVPKQSEMESIIGTSRNGSTVNGITNRHFAIISVSGTNYRGISGDLTGVILIPDDKNITVSKTLTYDVVDNTGNEISNSQLQEYLDEGCVFLPVSGYVYGKNHYWNEYSSWDTGRYWTTNSYSLVFNAVNLYLNNSRNDTSSMYMSVRLVRNAN